MPTATPRKRRTRKTTPAKPKVEVIKVTEPKTSVRPSTLLKSTDYLNDIKVRLEIHNYEVNALVNDIKWSYNKVKDYVVTTYKKEFAK